MANTYLTRTVATGGDRTKATLSVWVKKSSNAEQFLFYNHESNTTNFRIRFNPEVLQVETLSGSSVVGSLTTNRKFTDPSGFYHIVVAIDSTSGTADDRMKIYVNGVQETSFSARTNPPQNQNMAFNEQDHIQYIGSQVTANYFNGIMSHYYWIDGTAYTPSTFGSTDATTGEWKINTSPSITMGTNGFTILKDGNTITDQSSNSNDFSLGGGTLTKTEDSPSNVFATLNPLFYQATSEFSSITNGNTTFTSDSGTTFNTLVSTIGMSSGKYYFEVKRIAERGLVGITDVTRTKLNTNSTYYPGDTDNSVDWGYYSDDGKVYNNGNPTGSGATWGNGDIVGCAVDLDNRKIYWHKNGSYINSGNPSTGAYGQTISSDVTYYFAVAGYTSTTFNQNFGNGYFGTTAVSSAGSNASGIGIFEYNVPTGYSALSTKGLNL